MHKPKNNLNKRKLIDFAQSSLDEEFGPFPIQDNSSYKNKKVEYEEENKEIKSEKKDVEIRVKGEWEGEFQTLNFQKMRNV